MNQHDSTLVPKASTGVDSSLHQAAVNSRLRGPAGSVLGVPMDKSALDKRKARSVIDENSDQRVADVSSNTHFDIPSAALRAYRNAARSVATSDPSCHLSWGIIAAIGQVESDHGRYGGSSVLDDGTTSPRIVGLPLNGVGDVASIPDSDGGRLDGDRVWDRAVGPMQFIPTSWAALGADGDGDGVKNPSDFDDAALATAGYLCSGGGDMRVLSQARSAVYRYNHSDSYVDLVLSLAKSYDEGVVDVVPNDPTPPGHRDDPSDSPRRHNPRPDPQPKPDPKPHPNPKPDPDPKPDPQPDPVPPSPKPDPKPAPRPPAHPTDPVPPTHAPAPAPPTEPAPEPEPTTVTGVVKFSQGTWSVGKTELNFGAADLSLIQLNYDADATAEPVEDELEGLLGTTATVSLDSDLIVIEINSLAFDQDPTTSQAPPSSTAPPTTAPSTTKKSGS